MAYGVLYSEANIQAKDIDALNRFAKSSTADFDGGCLVALAAPTTDGDHVFTATVPATGGLTGLAIAYNPAEHLTVVNDKEFAGISKDPRDYTNLQGRVFSVFMPQLGDEIEITAECVDSSTRASVVAGDYIEAKNGQSTWTRKASSPTSGVTAAKVDVVANRPFPAEKGTVGISKQKVFIATIVQQ